MGINFEKMTVEDCIDLFEKREKAIVISNGKVVEIVED